MGLLVSLMGKGLPSSQQLLSTGMGALYKKFMQREIKDFENFHIAILDIFNNVNLALPGKHYDVPPHSEVKACFIRWKEEKNEIRRMKLLVDFLKEKVTLSKLDNTTLITGLVTPPVAMVAKRAGGRVPQISLIKYIPDVVFVPSATIIALVAVKLCRKTILKNEKQDSDP